MKQDVELDCPHCGGKIVPRVKSSTSHLYLSEQEQEEEEEEKEKEEEEEGTKGPES
jgi:DNA-directed RNA polymerase subunit RPC12/RpoP